MEYLMRNVLFVLLCFVSVVARGNDGDVFTEGGIGDGSADPL